MNSTTPTFAATGRQDSMDAQALALLARLLEYPQADYETRVEAAGRRLQAFDLSLQAQFQHFAVPLRRMTAEQREELYAATFDIGPACVPYVSIHLFGEENFKRGEFMAALMRRYLESQFETDLELPDHLSNLLRYATQADATERRDLAQFCLLGPLDRMIASLSHENPYRALLATIQAVMQAAYPGLVPAASPLEQMRHQGTRCGVATPVCGCGQLLESEAGLAPAQA